MNQNEIKNTHGGRRVGAGRKKGSTNKVTADEFFHMFRKTTKTEWLEELTKRMDIAYQMVKNATTDQERHEALNTANKLDSLILKYIFTDVQQIDVTSGGEKMGVQLVFTPKELDDWKQD